MATYTTCDMCGCKIKTYLYSLEIKNAMDPTDYETSFDLDLCNKCAKSVKDFIKEKRKVNEHIGPVLE